MRSTRSLIGGLCTAASSCAEGPAFVRTSAPVTLMPRAFRRSANVVPAANAGSLTRALAPTAGPDLPWSTDSAVTGAIVPDAV